MLAEDVYLLTSQTINGTAGTYDVPSNHKFTNTSGTVYTYTITSMPSGGFYFRIGVNGWEKNMQPYTNNDAITINGDSYSITSDCYGSSNAWKVSYTDGTYSSLTITVDLSTSSRYVKITGTTASSGGSDAGTTTTNESGYYIYGAAFNSTDPTKKMTYKLLKRSENEYYISVLANNISYNGAQRYSTGNGDDQDPLTYNSDNTTFQLAYVDPTGKVTSFYPSSDQSLNNSTKATLYKDSPKTFGGSTPWTIHNNGGMYTLVVKTDDNGKPVSWYYESDPNSIVAYRVGESSNWTTDAFVYNTKTSAGSYNDNYFGMVHYTKDEEFYWLIGTQQFAVRSNTNNSQDQKHMDISWRDGAKQSGDEQGQTAQNLKFTISKDGSYVPSGSYLTEFNPTRNNIIFSTQLAPNRIFIIGSAVSTVSGESLSSWKTSDAIELTWDSEEQCYKKLMNFKNGGHFDFILDHNESGAPASLDMNFVEDSNVPTSWDTAVGGDTWGNNVVEYHSGTTDTKDISFGPETNYYTIRFYIERKAGVTSGFNWANDGIYHYTLDPVSRPYAVISPAASTVFGQVSVTPSVQFVNPSTTTTIEEANQIVVYTLDGTNPAINTSTGEVATGSTAKKVTGAATAQRIGTLTYNGTNIVDNDGKVVVSGSNKVTVTAQAVRVITTDNGNIYELSGSPVSETYTLNKLSIKIDPGTMTVNYGEYVTPAVTVTDNNATSGSTLNYVYTLDGTEPRISSDGQTVNGKLVSYTPDDVITSNNPVGTLYMDGNGNIQEQGTTTSPITAGNTAVTIKAYAVKVQTVDGTTTYEAQGNLASATYTFKKAGGVSPTASYTISVSNDAGSDAVSVNKATATVTVVNSSTNTDDGVAVYYTTDGTDPSTSDTRHLVRNRKITVYALGQNVGSTQKIRVAIAGSAASKTDDGKTHASCTYDLTYSTSEGGYENYLNNDPDAKTLGGDGHVIIYVKPSDTSGKTYVYAYENIKGTDGTTTANLLTPMEPGRELTSSDQTTVNGETWYYLDAEPTDGYKEINLQISSATKTGYVTVANINKDVFLEFNTTTGVITDVTRAHTADYFYTTGATSGNTKDEAANPTADAPFIYVQVPAEWATSPNTLKILDSNDTEISGVTYTKQNGAETSANSVCYKISGLTSLTSGTSTIKFAPYNTTSSTYGTLANHSFSTTYQNGGYYYYESSTVNGLGLIFSPTTGSETDVRSKGHHDINHVTTGDKTNYLNKTWDNATSTTSITDDWTGKTGNVYQIASGTTISQTVNGLTASTAYTVQMIVRGESGATGTMTLTGTDTKTATGSFSGYTSTPGTISTGGRVDSLYTDLTNGWHKLEATANSTTDGKLTIKLEATGNELELSDVTLLEKANTTGYVWTHAPTTSSVTECDLSSRSTANAYSFFDRGENHNAIVYADANTVVGRDDNALDIAVPTSTANAYNMAKFALTDNPDSKTSDYSFGIKNGNTITAKKFSFDRKFTKVKNEGTTVDRSTICFPFAMTTSQVTSIFGTNAKLYTITSVDEDKLVANASEVTTTTTANTPYVLDLDNTGAAVTKDGISYDSELTLVGHDSSVEMTNEITDGTNATGNLVGVYTQTTKYRTEDSYANYGYDANRNRFNYYSKNGGRIKPFRAYLHVKNASNAKPYYLFKIVNTPTGIMPVTDKNFNNDAPLYNLQGMYVGKGIDIQSLPAGIYIQNGRKFVKK